MYSRFIYPVAGVAWGVAVVWRILLVGTDGSLYLIVRCLFQFRCLNSALWTWYCYNVFLRTLVVWHRLSIVNSFSLLDPRWKMWIVRVLPLGVLDEPVWCSQLLGCLVIGGRWAPPEACYFWRICHICALSSWAEEGSSTAVEDRLRNAALARCRAS